MPRLLLWTVVPLFIIIIIIIWSLTTIEQEQLCLYYMHLPPDFACISLLNKASYSELNEGTNKFIVEFNEWGGISSLIKLIGLL